MDVVEHFAIRCAKGNNGGEWSTHYTEEQKEFWREFARQLIQDIRALGDLATLKGQISDYFNESEAR